MTTVDKIMSRRVLDVDMDVSLQDVRGIFQHVRFHHILVKEGEQLVGIISDRDLLKAVRPYAGTTGEPARRHPQEARPSDHDPQAGHGGGRRHCAGRHPLLYRP